VETTLSDRIVQVPLSELRGGEWVSLMWGFFWRGLVYTILCAIGGALMGGLAGGVIGAIMGASGSSIEEIGRITGPVGFLLGLALGIGGLRLYLPWLLGARYGSLRLAVLRVHEGQELPSTSAA
jgi:hypothetical protein